MTFSPARAGVFFLIGLPIGFVLSALGFVVSGQEISAPQIAPFAGGIAIVIAVAAGLWRRPS
ncbi:hypothetical protein [Aurantiacibacter zhengii]|uniref:Uncharacterized protein n=1 Tax=Aurantiacibacter zhengii TaxID=2307003 RepID=A0A418NWW9_9SPHN|nr:hypothetical protein [Aurantiacibacter zhengii]RIV89104.1 hypothetical protein D2V07_02315 [Aurantiacibacter zhengii]